MLERKRPSGLRAGRYLQLSRHRGEKTNNSFFQFEAVVPTGGEPPPHIHGREDESFYVVSGSLEIVLGDLTYQARPVILSLFPAGPSTDSKTWAPARPFSW
jgi:uncharacterized cupin superfamily protein